MARSSLRAPTARDSSGIDAALLVLRLTLGILILLHGIGKLPPPPAFIAGELAKVNRPPQRRRPLRPAQLGRVDALASTRLRLRNAGRSCGPAHRSRRRRAARRSPRPRAHR